VNRKPILACRFHTDITAVIVNEPVPKKAQALREGRETLDLVLGNFRVVSGCDTRYKEVLMDIHTATDGINDFEIRQIKNPPIKK
jgi:hypothetical protein